MICMWNELFEQIFNEFDLKAKYNPLFLNIQLEYINVWYVYNIYNIQCKNIDDRNFLKPVYGKYVQSQLVSKVNNSPKTSQTEGVIYCGERESMFLCIEDQGPSSSRLCLLPPNIFVLICHQWCTLNRHKSLMLILLIL